MARDIWMRRCDLEEVSQWKNTDSNAEAMRGLVEAETQVSSASTIEKLYSRRPGAV